MVEGLRTPLARLQSGVVICDTLAHRALIDNED